MKRFAVGFLSGFSVLVLTIGALAAGQTAPKKKVIRLETITVEGRIQKPQAFYILQRSNLNFGELEKNPSLLDKIVKSVDKEPF
jgi:hypothetical protein